MPRPAISALGAGEKIVKLNRLLLCISIACVSAGFAFGQPDCNVSNKLICQFPVSAQSLTVNVTGGLANSAAYKAAFSAALTAASAINESVAAQLTQLPVPSATLGVVSLKRKGREGGEVFTNLGPILTDRPDTVGQGHLFGGFTFQHFNFNAVDGTYLGALPIGFKFSIPQSPTTVFGSTTSQVSFQMNQYVGMLTYGLNRTTDLSVIVPVNNVTLRVTSSQFNALEADNCPDARTDCVYNNVSGTTTSNYVPGSASGIGDVALNLKHMFVGQEGDRTAIAAGATFRFPSGDSFNYLGSGAMGGSLYTLMEYRAPVAPHVKIGYQWNNASKALNLLGSLQGSSPPRLPGGLQYDLGSDLRVRDNITVAADILGNQTVNGGVFSTASLSVPTSTGNQTIYTTKAGKTSYTTVHFSGGVKFEPRPGLLFYANVLVQMNNVGLRSEPVPLFGIAYNYHRRSKPMN